MPWTWPLVGRREELSHVEALLRSGTAAGVVVAGEAGVGKTRFMAAIARAAERSDARRHRLPRRAPPPRSRSARWRTCSRSPDRAPADGFFELLQHAGESLRKRAGERRLVLAVDDAHLLDDASAALVHRLAATGVAFVLLTIRAGEPVHDSTMALWKDGLAEYMQLQPLSETEVGELVALALDGEVGGGTLRRLWEITRGNALFLHERVVEALERGTLGARDGLWRWTGPAQPGARLQEIVRARIGSLSGGELDALELAALGEPIGTHLLERLISPMELAPLERRGLISLERSGRRLDARLAHPLYGEVLRARAPIRTARWAQLAEALEQTAARRREDLMRLATWRLEGGVPGRPELLAAAAWRAWASSDPALAERLATAAVDAGGRFEAQLTLALALRSQERFREADARGALEDARRLLQEAGLLYDDSDPAGFGSTGCALLSQARAQAGDRTGAERALAQAQAQATRRPGFRIFDADLGLAHAWTAAVAGELSAGRAHALLAADDAQDAGHFSQAAVALHELARLGETRLDPPRLRALASRLDGPLPAAYAAHSQALAEGDPAALERAGAEFEAIGAQLLAAEAYAEACAHCRSHGLAASAARCATRAGALIERFGHPRTPALAGLGEAPALTPREREVASLAASGLSNRAIAERLVISVRTVEHHLEHAYQKLGVGDRGALAEQLGSGLSVPAP